MSARQLGDKARNIVRQLNAWNELDMEAAAALYAAARKQDWEAVLNIAAARNVSKDEALAILLKSMPQGRLTTAAEVAGAVAWLCAPDSSSVTGIALPVAGGEVG